MRQQQSTSSFRNNNTSVNNPNATATTAAAARLKRQNSIMARQNANNNNNNNNNKNPSSPIKHSATSNSKDMKENKNSNPSASHNNNLSNSELREMKETFEAFDEDHSGTIDVEELQQIMKHLGHNISERDSAVLLQQVSNDPNRDGLLFDELVNLLMLFKETAQYKLLETDSVGNDANSSASRHDDRMYDNSNNITSNVGNHNSNSNNNNNLGINHSLHHHLHQHPLGLGSKRSTNNLSGLRRDESTNSGGFRRNSISMNNNNNDPSNVGRRASSTSLQQNSEDSKRISRQSKRNARTHAQQFDSSDGEDSHDGSNNNDDDDDDTKNREPGCCASCCYNLISPMLPFLSRARPTDSFPTTAWHLLMMFWAAYFWFVPLLIDTNSSGEYLHKIVKATIVPTAIGTAFLILDIFVQMFLVSDPEELLEWSTNKNYMWRHLWLDVISAVPFEWVLLPDFVNSAMSQTPCRVLMHLRLVKLISGAYNYFIPSRVVRSSRVYIFVHAFFVPVIKSSVLFICMVHLLAVIWSAVSPSATYDQSMLFAAYTVSGVGYGIVDFVTTTPQRLLASAYCLLAPINVSIVVGSTITLLSQSNVAISNRHGVIETLRICEMSNYNKAVTADILGYREHLNTISVSASHGDITDCLPDALKRNITLFVKTRLVQNTAIFQMAHRTTQVALAQSLEDLVLRPGQVVCYVNETVSDLYLISHGKIALISDDGEISEFIYGGACINDIGLLRGHVRQQLTARAVCHCEIFVLTRKIFSTVCKKFPVFGKAVLEVRSQLKAVELARKRELKAAQRRQKLMMKKQQQEEKQQRLEQAMNSPSNRVSSMGAGSNFSGVVKPLRSLSVGNNNNNNNTPTSPQNKNNNDSNNKQTISAGGARGSVSHTNSSVLNVFSGDHTQSLNNNLSESNTNKQFGNNNSLVAEPSSFYKSYPRSDGANNNNNNNPLSIQAAQEHVEQINNNNINNKDDDIEMQNISTNTPRKQVVAAGSSFGSTQRKPSGDLTFLDAPKVQSRKGSTVLDDENENQVKISVPSPSAPQQENAKNIHSASKILEPENSARHVGATYVFQMLTALARNHNIDFSTIVNMQRLKQLREKQRQEALETRNEGNNNINVASSNMQQNVPPQTVEQAWDRIDMMSPPEGRDGNDENPPGSNDDDGTNNTNFDYDSFLHQSSNGEMTASAASTFVATVQGMSNNNNNNPRVAAVASPKNNTTTSSRLAALKNESIFGGQVQDSDASSDDGYGDHDDEDEETRNARRQRRKERAKRKKDGKSMRNNNNQKSIAIKTNNANKIGSAAHGSLSSPAIANQQSIDGSMITTTTITTNTAATEIKPSPTRVAGARKRSKSGGGASNSCGEASSNEDEEAPDHNDHFDDDDDDDDEDDDDDDDAWSRDEDDERSAIYELLIDTSDEDLLDLTDLVATQAGQGEQSIKAEKSELAACEREMMRIEKLLLFLEKKTNLNEFANGSRQGSGALSGGVGVGGSSGGNMMNRNNLHAIGSQATLLTAMSRGGSNRFSSRHSTTSHRSNSNNNNNNNNQQVAGVGGGGIHNPNSVMSIGFDVNAGNVAGLRNLMIPDLNGVGGGRILNINTNNIDDDGGEAAEFIRK